MYKNMILFTNNSQPPFCWFRRVKSIIGDKKKGKPE